MTGTLQQKRDLLGKNSDEDYRIIFCNLDEIFSVQQEIWSDLETVYNEWPNEYLGVIFHLRFDLT